MRGQKRALLRQSKILPRPVNYEAPETDKTPAVEEADPKSVNLLARERMKLRLLADIRVDLEICAIEGWDKKTYIRELKQLIDSIS